MAAPLIHPTDANDLALTARLVRHAAQVMAVMGFLIALVLGLENSTPIDHVWLHVMVGMLGLATLALLHQGQQRAAAFLMVWGFWALLALVTARITIALALKDML